MSRPHRTGSDRGRESSRPGWLAAALGLIGGLARRHAFRGALVALTVAILATFAHWSAAGFLTPGGLERLVQMKNTPGRSADGGSDRKGALDRARLNSLMAATQRQRP